MRVAGVDEVGRGPLAGPVVAACVVLDPAIFTGEIPAYMYAIDDSKKLTPAKRAELAAFLKEQAGVEIGMAVVDSETIDRINILEATRLAMHQALAKLNIPADHLLIDGTKLPGATVPQTPLIQGDGRSLSIASASIVAKVFRDGLMEDYDKVFPHYGFAKHKGYGTAQHLENLKKYGACDLHRRSFAPVRSVCMSVS